MQEALDVLIPSCNRPCALAMTLTSLAAQTWQPMSIIISDQSEGQNVLERPEIAAVLRFLRHGGREVHAQVHLPKRGIAEQRAFLLQQSRARYCLFLDDDVLLESDLVERMMQVMQRTRCGFVGSALHGLSYLHDERPEQQAIEFWSGAVEPERIEPGDARWARHHLHSAANLLHVQARTGAQRDHSRWYKVAWVGGCVLYDSDKLRQAGGFEFWRELPAEHCGEDVLAQLRVMARYGGCGLYPSGAYHMELPTTVTSRQVDAPRVLSVAHGPAEHAAQTSKA